MATIGSFAKVLRWHWSARRGPSGQCQDAHRCRIKEDRQYRKSSAAGLTEIGAAWKKTTQDAAASSLLLDRPGPKPRDPQEPPGPRATQRSISSGRAATVPESPTAGTIHRAVRWKIVVLSSSANAEMAFGLLHAGGMLPKFIS